MIDFQIKRGKVDDKYFVCILIKDHTIIQPLVDGLSHFFEVLDIKQERTEERT